MDGVRIKRQIEFADCGGMYGDAGADLWGGTQEAVAFGFVQYKQLSRPGYDQEESLAHFRSRRFQWGTCRNRNRLALLGGKPQGN